jgi:hypothetical protein
MMFDNNEQKSIKVLNLLKVLVEETDIEYIKPDNDCLISLNKPFY